MKTARRLLVLLALAASVLAVQSASASNSPNMRIDYSLNDTTSGRTHSDIAFWGNIAVAGNYDGFRVFNTDTHLQLGPTSCAEARRTMSLSGSTTGGCCYSSRSTRRRRTVKRSAARTERATRPPAGPACFEGIRIFDLTNPSAPVYIKGVYTQCGSHTHTLVPDLRTTGAALRLVVSGEHRSELCVSPHAKISIVSVPLDAPETASVIATPTIDAPPYIGVGCHDITVFLANPQGGGLMPVRGPDLGHQRPGQSRHASPGSRRRPERELLALGRVHVGRPVRRVRRRSARELHVPPANRGRSASTA